MLLGLAGTVKASAIAPVAVVVILVAVLARRRLAPLVGGVFAGFAVPSFPFFLLAPSAFVQDVVLTQVARFPGAARATVIDRLARMTFGGRPVGILEPSPSSSRFSTRSASSPGSCGGAGG